MKMKAQTLSSVALATLVAAGVFALGYFNGVRDTQLNMARAVLRLQFEQRSSLTIRPLFRPPFPVKPSNPLPTEPDEP